MSTLLLTGGDVCDVETGTVRRQDVLVVDGRIREVAPRTSVDPGSREVEVHDASGSYLMPGLIDAHVHVIAGQADLGAVAEASPSYVAAQASVHMRDMLRRGFTSVRDCGGADFGIAAAVEDGLWEGPRVHFGGKALSPTGGHADLRGPGAHLQDDHPCCPHLGALCDGVAEVRRAARTQLRTGAHHIKLMLSGGVASPTDRVDSLQFSDEEIRAAVEEAANANRYTTGHAYTARAVNRALNLGVRCIEHGNLIDRESVQLFVEHGAFLVPTLVTYEYLNTEGAAAGLPEASQRKVADVLGAGLEALRMASEGGVQIALGTDLLGAMQPHQSEEFRIRAQVQSSVDVVRSATTVGASLLGRSGEIGVVKEGALADVIQVDANPFDDVTVLANPHEHLRAVFQGGRLVGTS